MANPKSDWRRLFDSEAAARYELDRLAQDGKLPGNALRYWWKSVEDLLYAYGLAIAENERPEPPPAELASVLSGLAGHLAVGQIPDPIKDAATEGRRPPGP